MNKQEGGDSNYSFLMRKVLFSDLGMKAFETGLSSQLSQLLYVISK